MVWNADIGFSVFSKNKNGFPNKNESPSNAVPY